MYQMEVTTTRRVMDSRVNAETMNLELPKMSVDTVRPHVESFTQGLTVDQWNLLAVGKPDNDTRLRLADMLVKVLCSVVDIMSDFLKQEDAVERLRDTLDEPITRSFAEALGVETVKGPSSAKLTELIAKEVTAPSGYGQPKPSKSMIHSVCKMLKRFAAKMCCTVKRNGGQNQNSKVVKDLESPITPITQSVQDIINNEVRSIIEPILEDVSDSEYDQLHEQFTLEIQRAAQDIAHSVSEYINLKEVESFYPSPKTQQQTQKGLKTNICNFFVKMFAKAGICRVFSQVKMKFRSETKVGDNDSVKSLLVDAESVLQNGVKNEMGEGDVCIYRRLENISSDDVLELTGKLSDLLYSRITGETASEAVRGASPGRAVFDNQPYASMYADIQHRVICFLSLMSWWLENQVQCYSDRVINALIDTETVPKPQISEVTAGEEPEAASGEIPQEDVAQAEVSRTCLRLVISTLIKKIWKTVKGDRTFFTDLEFTIQRLVDEIWAQLEGTQVDITPKNVENLCKVIFQHLFKKWGSAARILISIERGDPDLPRCIAVSCKTHLNKQRRDFFRFLST